MYRTDYLKANGGYVCIPQAWGADYISIFKLAINGGIASSNLPLVSFRLSGENISSQLDKKIIGKLEANKIAFDITKDLVVRFSDDKWKSILLKDIEVWKRRLDRNTLCYCRIEDILKVLKDRKKYGFGLMTFIKAKTFYYLIVKRHK